MMQLLNRKYVMTIHVNAVCLNAVTLKKLRKSEKSFLLTFFT
jgi:hypothetical protein